MAIRRGATSSGARRSAHTSVPLRRGTAVVAVAGGALTLIGAAAPSVTPLIDPADALAVIPAARTAPSGETPVIMRTDVEPVDPEPAPIDAADLVKAVQQAEQEVARVARVTAERAAMVQQAAQAKSAAEKAVTGALGCGLSTSGLGAVKAHVKAAANFLGCLFGEPTMHGVAGRAGTSDHPSGKAIDFMVDRSTGDRLADCALRNKSALGITYVIWRQRINYGSGWEGMADRGGVTANHFDHVHVSFGSSAGGLPKGC